MIAAPMAMAEIPGHRLAPAHIAYLEAGHRAGCPADQMVRLFKGAVALQPQQLAMSAAARLCDLPDGPTEVGVGGARGGGKSFWALAQAGADDCQRCPGLKVLLLRKVGKSQTEAIEDLRRMALKGVPHRFVSNKGTLHFPNGSKIIVGHFKTESDIDAYLGLEYDLIIVEEGTTLTESKIRNIRTCLRTSKPNWRPRMYITTNPGNIGHQWFKKKFVMPWRAERAGRAPQTATRFVPATFKDNRFLNTEYVEVLNDLKGWQLAAWRDGDWDVMAGMFFTAWRDEIHVTDVPPASEMRRVWAALDYGYNHPTRVGLYGDKDGITYKIDECGGRHTLVQEHARAILAMLAINGVKINALRVFVAGKDCFDSGGRDENGKSIAEQYEQHGITLTPANTDRMGGAARMLEMLGDPTRETNPIAPTLYFSRKCSATVECIAAMIHDPDRPDDVLKVDIDTDTGEGGDDAYDETRYGLMAAEGSWMSDANFLTELARRR